MILCDMDGVLATGEGGDTAFGRRIYRTFREIPQALRIIADDPTPFHVVTAKTEAEAEQVVEAIGVETYVDSVVGADRLFWPTVWTALKQGRLPDSLSKASCLRNLSNREGSTVVMIEDHRAHLVDMLMSGTIDHGVLVPRIAASGDRLATWFDLDLALTLGWELATGRGYPAGWISRGVRILGWKEELKELVPCREMPADDGDDRFVLELPEVVFPGGTSAGPQLESLDTGRLLQPGKPNVVTGVRAARRILKRFKRPRLAEP